MHRKLESRSRWLGRRVARQPGHRVWRTASVGARTHSGGRSGSGGCRRQHRGRALPPLQWP
eukprot:scaffold4647_cov146-Isochrysis_galbana.AAC.2